MFVHGSVQKREMLTRRIRIDRRLIHHLLDGARLVRRSAGVADDPIVRAFARNARFTEKHHDVKRILLDPRLMKKEQIAGFRLFAIATDEIDVVQLEHLRVRRRKFSLSLKLRNSTLSGNPSWSKSTFAPSSDRFEPGVSGGPLERDIETYASTRTTGRNKRANARVGLLVSCNMLRIIQRGQVC